MNYRPGDWVEAIKTYDTLLTEGQVYSVLGVKMSGGFLYLNVLCDNGNIDGFPPKYWFKPAGSTAAKESYMELFL